MPASSPDDPTKEEKELWKRDPSLLAGAEKPLAGHPLYCMAKAGLAMMTKSLARELGPAVRVNGVSPGAILWPEQGQENQQAILDATALGRAGDPDDIAATVAWLALEAPYITGQILAVDGGRSLSFPGG